MALPNNAEHVFWSKRATGINCERTHRLIDSYSAILGKKHRDFFHDPFSAMIVADMAEGPRCRVAALNHLTVDKLYSSPETKIFMEMIRLAEKPVKQEPSNLTG